MYWSWRGLPEAGERGGVLRWRNHPPPPVRRTRGRWSGRVSAVGRSARGPAVRHGRTATSLALLARKAGGTERPNGLGADLPDRDTDGASATARPDSVACERGHATSGLLRRVPE